MKNPIRTFSHMIALALIMWLGLIAGAANANANVLQLDGWNSKGGSGVAAFGDAISAPFFNDVLTYTLPGGSFGKHQSNMISLGLGSGIYLSSFHSWDGNLLVGSGSQDGLSSSLRFIGGTTPVNDTLKVSGFGDFGSDSYYGKNIGSPDPDRDPDPQTQTRTQTYAMMLVGFVLVGFSARRRKEYASD